MSDSHAACGPWRHWCIPNLRWRMQGETYREERPGMWTSLLDPCPRCGRAAPEFPPIDPEYLDKKREELRDEYRTGLDSPPD